MGGHLSISAISQMLLARFGSNFKQWVLGTYTTDYNCHHDICTGNICPGDICPYQQYLSCYWPDLDHTLNKGSWEYIQQDIVPVHAILDEITTWCSLCSLSNCPNFNQKFNFKLLCPLKYKNPTYGSKVTAISNKIR